MKIAIIGGSGFIGKYLVAKLHNDHQLSIVTRQTHLDSSFNAINNLTVFSKHGYSTEELIPVLKQHDVVINLIGILNEKGHTGQGFYDAHVELTKNIIAACKANKVPRYLQMSALHADAENGPSHYQRSKGLAEDYAHAQHSDSFAVTSFRPSVIFGPGDSFCNRFAQLIKLLPFAFPLACAHARFAPVYAGDVADIFIQVINDQDTYDQGINICGPTIYTLGEIVTLTAEALDKKRLVIPLPNSIAYMQAIFLDYCIPGKPFSIDNYNSLKVDSTCDKTPLGTETLEQTIQTYLHLPLDQQNNLIMKA